MSLQVWLPLCGNTNNQGLFNASVTNTGATVNSAGKIGQCYAFNGTNSYLALDSLNVGGWKEMSISAWVKPTSNLAYLFLIRQLNSTSVPHQIRISNDGFSLRDSAHDTMYTIGWNYTFTAGTWVHICCTYKQGEIGMYCNGVCTNYSSTYYNANAQLNSTNETRIAQIQTSTATNYFSGSINDVRIYDHCLSQAEVHEIAKGKIIHLKLANNGFGNPNLITRSTFTSAPWAAAITGTETYKGKDAITVRNSTLYTQTSNGTTSIFPAITFAANTQYTLSLDWCDHLRSDGLNSTLYLRFKYSDGTYSNVISPTSNPDANWTHVKLTSTAGKTVAMMTTTYGNGGVVSIANLKLEVGAQETAYSPPINELDNVEYDCSGYRHDATKNAITPVFDSARYGAAAVFNGSSSYAKVNDNTWMADRMPAMTINLWAKSTAAWNANTHFFSCTEGGGFNTESGNSGYLRFPISVYTADTGSSYAYKFDSQEIKLSDLPVGEWVMLTWIYDLTGTRTYINGDLHHTYTNTSYGIHFYTSARLFLGCEASAANPSSPYFNGQLSDFRLYSTALSEEDIKILYRTSGFVDNQGNMFVREVKEV